MPATIRRAQSEDADFIAWTILSAQRSHRPRGWFDIALNRSEPDCLAFIRQVSVTQAESWWHTSRFWIAEADGIAAAALCALRAGDGCSAVRPAIEEVLNAAGMEAMEQAAIWRRGAYARACWIPGDDDNWMIEHVATRPSHRGRGLVQGLLDHALETGKALGFERASIPFYIGNEAAERCYAKAGFSFAEKNAMPPSRRSPAHRTFAGSSARSER